MAVYLSYGCKQKEKYNMDFKEANKDDIETICKELTGKCNYCEPVKGDFKGYCISILTNDKISIDSKSKLWNILQDAANNIKTKNCGQLLDLSFAEHYSDALENELPVKLRKNRFAIMTSFGPMETTPSNLCDLIHAYD